jgi:hypothetical protein
MFFSPVKSGQDVNNKEVLHLTTSVDESPTDSRINRCSMSNTLSIYPEANFIDVKSAL